MAKEFTWIDFYKEMASWVLTYRSKQSELCQILRDIGNLSNLEDVGIDGRKKPLEVMDPFTFFAFFQKLKISEKRLLMLEKFNKIARLKSALPTDLLGIPSANATALWYFPQEINRKGFELNILWDLAEQAVKGELRSETFDLALSISGIQIAKLTQGLFWLNPEKFYPIDKHQTFLQNHDISPTANKLSDYITILHKIQLTLNKPFYQLSHEAWEWSGGKEKGETNPSLFEKVKQKFDSKTFQQYTENLQRIVNQLNLTKNDERLVFSVLPDRLNFTVGQRYCLNLYVSEPRGKFGVISKDRLSTDSGAFNGNQPQPFYTYFQDLTTEFNGWDSIMDAIKEELDRTTKSGFRKSNNAEFESYVFGNGKPIQMKNYPLNTIFYGPPGTGKTFHTVLRAAEIVENRSISTYKEALEIFNANLHNTIEFITFHQNYSYEDFIQGLRPDTENNRELTFERKDGVFKTIADRAYRNLLESASQTKAKLSFEETFSNVFADLMDGSIHEFELKMKKSSFFVTNITDKSIEFRKQNGDSIHTLSIRTLNKMYDRGLNDIIFGGLQLYYEPLLSMLLKKGEVASQTVKKQNYVLIIDEINRANISRVFGELITLIEPDKRSGGAIPLETMLPSGDKFIVPSNLYIVGTMNTADKSIALLDIALRRRFDFEAMFPKYKIEGETVYDVDILKKINEKIIKTKGHDFQVGHAYFMGENKDLVQRMNKKVIPLLMEYFMSDVNEVKEILQYAGLKIDESVWPMQIKDGNY